MPITVTGPGVGRSRPGIGRIVVGLLAPLVFCPATAMTAALVHLSSWLDTGYG